MYTKKNWRHNHTKVHWPALMSDVLQIRRASLGRLTRAWLALWSSMNLKYISACKKTLRLSINLLKCAEHTLECAERTLDVADDFGYDMPGQRQKKVSERCWGFPSTTQRQVMRNTSNNSGDGTLTMVPICRGLSGTKITLGKWWKSRGQVEQTMDVTGGFIYYWYLTHDSSPSHLIWLRGWRSLCYY